MKIQELAQSRIYVAGHRGLIGSALVRVLRQQGVRQILQKAREELDLREQGPVQSFFRSERPDYVFLTAAKVGGIQANDKLRGDFILENLQIQTNVISAAFESGVKKLVFFGSSCSYPKFAPQPIPENSLLTGALEETNEAYGAAKIAGMMLCKSLMIQYGRPFISVVPAGAYGPGDNYDPSGSHVLPALIRKFHEAKVSGASSVSAWGRGTPLREFIYVDDIATAAIFCLLNYEMPIPLNIGTGQEVSIRELTEMVAKTVGFHGEVIWDTSKPDGTPRKLLDASRISQMGWKPAMDLQRGLSLAYEDFLARYCSKTG